MSIEHQRILKNLYNSTRNVASATASNISYFEKNLFQIIIFPNIIDADIDVQNYTKQIAELKESETLLATNEDGQIIVSILKSIPTIEAKEFKIYWNKSIWIAFLILPLGIILWIGYYLKISQLIGKLREIQGKLGTIEFMLKAATT